MAYDELKLENQLCHRFYVIANAFARFYRPLLERIDLTYPQYLVMMALWEKSDVAVSQLVQKTQIDAGAMTLILRKLVSKGYVTLHADESDRRVRRVVLSREGEALQNDARRIPEQARCHVSAIPMEELVALAHTMDKIRGELQSAIDRDDEGATPN